MKKIVSAILCVCILFSCQIAYAQETLNSLLQQLRTSNNAPKAITYREIVDYADEHIPYYGFSHRDFLDGSTNSGAMWYSFDDDLQYTVFFDSDTLLFNRIEFQSRFDDNMRFLDSTAAIVDICSYIADVDFDLIGSDFNDLIHTLYFQEKTFFYNGYRLDISFRPFDQREALISLYPDDGKYQEPSIHYQTNWTYEELARYPEYYLGDRLSVNGKILQIDGNREYGFAMLLSHNNNTFYVLLSPPYMPSYNLLVGDNVTFNSIFAGNFTYTSIWGTNITVPMLNVEEVKLHK